MKKTPIESWVIQSTGIKEYNRSAVESYQLSKLKETIAYAKAHGRFYESYLKDIDEKNIHSLSDFQQLPFTRADHLSENPLYFLCVPQTEVKRIVTLNTTGTSGDVKRIFFSEEDMKSNLEFFKVGMSCLVNKEDKVLVLLPGNAYGTIGDFLKSGLEKLGIPCFVEGVLKDLEKMESLIKQEQITCIVGIPTQVQYFSRIKGETFKKYIKKVLLSTDFVPEALTKELTETYGCAVFNHYGMTEMGYGAAVECEALDGYHLREADLYFEIVDSETGMPVQEGEIGEVVFSTLQREAMPLIRYRTGDLASIKSEACSCGTFLRTMNRVLGRINNKIMLSKNQYLTLRELDELLLSFEEILDYNAYLSEEEEFVIEVLTKDWECLQQVKSEIEQSVLALLQKKGNGSIKLRVGEKKENKPTELKNSVIKRRIMDYRKS